MSQEPNGYGPGGRLTQEVLSEVLREKGRLSASVRKALEIAFSPDEVTEMRVAGFDFVFKSIAVDAVTRRLNDVFGSSWSFEIIRNDFLPPQDPTQIVVLARIIVKGEFGDIVKEAFGQANISRQDGIILNIGFDMKAAASDALKKAATLLGVGLYLYGEARESRRVAQQIAPRPQGSFPPDQFRGGDDAT